ncbi:hypothetical protein V6Z11_A12G134300 [Gossypium hirsutum]
MSRKNGVFNPFLKPLKGQAPKTKRWLSTPFWVRFRRWRRVPPALRPRGIRCPESQSDGTGRRTSSVGGTNNAHGRVRGAAPKLSETLGFLPRVLKHFRP